MKIGFDLGGSLIKVSLKLNKSDQNDHINSYKEFIVM